MNLLITGGTGSLGGAVVNHLLAEDKEGYYEKIIIYSRDEQKQDEMRQAFNNHPRLRFLIGDIRDKSRLAFAMQHVQHVIHAAALKIVPSIEYNPMECIKTNVLGAQNLIEVCLEHRYASNIKVMALSTDKAVSPINLYGASKLASEKLFLNANNLQGTGGPKFSIARYGNVVWSRGSVVPLFINQMVKTGILTVTHEEMTRFWITLHDAALFVTAKLISSKGNEVFIPDMKSFRVMDLVQALVDHFPEKKLKHEIIGVRPGEKIHEELITKYEIPNTEYGLLDFIIRYPEKNPIEDQESKEIIYNMSLEGFNSNSSFVHRLSSADIADRLVQLKIIPKRRVMSKSEKKFRKVA